MSIETITCLKCDKASCAVLTLDENEVQELEKHTSHTNMRAGDLLLRQGAPFHSIIYLRSGYVKEFVINDNGPDQIVKIIKPKSYIGLQSLFSSKESAFSYQSITDIKICYIEQHIFSSRIENNGNFAREILASLSNESLGTQMRILGLNQKQIFGKVADTILYMAEQVYDSKEFDLKLSRTELAQMIASTRESVTKALIWFHQEEMIEMNRNRINILDNVRLKEIAKKG